ncbi:MAG TPA: DUF669 domain-containing protein [Gammaproteobacteria bacterium]|nr:DUF669 domain-containing protein [Gammaproteobacteria bacterium]
MQLMNPFNARQVDPTQSGGQMPVGRHPVVIKNSEIKPTKDNTGGMLVLELEIIDGPSKGVTGAYRLNLYHNNPQTVEIAHRQLSAICHVIGVYDVQDSQQLHGIPFIVEVGLQKDTEAASKGYTEVKKVFDMNGNEPGKAAAGGGQPAGGQPAQAQGGSQWGQPAAQQPAQGGQPAWGGQPAGGQPTGQQQQPAAAWGQQPNANAGQPTGGAPAWATRK